MSQDFSWANGLVSELTTPSTKPVPSLLTYYTERYPKYSTPPHIRLLLSTLEGLKPGQGLILNLPPRHGKTECLRAYLEWYIGQNQDKDIISAAYTARLAQKTSRAVRNSVLDSSGVTQKYFPTLELAPDSRNVGEWNTTQGGGVLSTGVGGSVTGFGAHLLLIDDPVKSREQAESATFRERTLDWLRADVFTRLAPDAIVILNQTRWHPEDPAGWMLEQIAEDPNFLDLEWVTLSLPAIAEKDEHYGDFQRNVGMPLWAERYGIAKLEKRRAALGDYDFEALFQQGPRKRGGSVFRDGVKRFVKPDPTMTRMIIFVDTAASKKSSADYTAIVAMSAKGWSKDNTLEIEVREVLRARLDLLELGIVLQGWVSRYNTPIHIEQTVGSLPILTYLWSIGLAAVGVIPRGDKFSRAQPFAAAWNGGRAKIPEREEALWLSDYLPEMLSFTGNGDGHDDQVDASSGAYTVLANQMPPVPPRASTVREY